MSTEQSGTEHIPTEEIIRSFEAICPEPAQIKIRNIKQYPSFNHQVEAFSVEFKHDSGKSYTKHFFVKSYLGQLCWWVLHAPDLAQRENHALRIAAGADIPLAEEYGRYRHSNITFAVSKFVEGSTLTNKFSENAVKHIAQILAQPHTIKIQDADKRTLPVIDRHHFISRMRTWSKEGNDNILRQGIDIVEKQFADVDTRPPSIIHGDCHAGNLLVKDQKLAALLDWESCAIGDARIDIATLHRCIGRQHSIDLAQYFVAEYQKAAGWKTGDLSPWKNLLNLRDAILVSLIRHRIEHNISLPPTRLGAWINYNKEASKIIGTLVKTGGR